MNNKNNKIYLIIALIIVIIDQATKLYFKGFNLFGISHQGYEYGELVPVIGDFVQFTYILNPGMAFGAVFIPKIFLSLFSIFAAVVLAMYLARLPEKVNTFVKIAIMLILAGAAGNLIDRVFYGVIFDEKLYAANMNQFDRFVYMNILHEIPLFYGKVVDFIQVDIPDVDFMGLYYTHWPVFNVADSCVSIGVVLLLIFHNQLPPLNDTFGKKNNQVTDNEVEEDEPENNKQ